MAQQIEIDDDGYMSSRHAAAALGVTSQTIRNYTRDGCPFIASGPGRGGGIFIKLSDFVKWRAAKELERAGVGADVEGEDGQVYNFDRAKAVDMHYRAVKRQADAHRDLGNLVAVDDIADVVAAEYGEVASRLRSVPARIAVRVAAQDNPDIVRELIADEISECLRQLSTPSEVIEEAGGNPVGSIDAPLAIADELPDEDERIDEDEEDA